MDRRRFLQALGASVALPSRPKLRAGARPPNVVLILADDLGFGDVGAYGSTLLTPNIDRMATEGMLFRQICTPASVCSPSRAGLLTGRYGARVGVPDVLFPDSQEGLAENEMTMASGLKSAGYRTMCIGKWHLGCKPAMMPTNRGFDEFYGLPYSNDMSPLPLMRNLSIVEATADNNLLTQRYTERAVDWIKTATEQPFFLYLAHNVPHLPFGVSPDFRSKSKLGGYADAVAELDWSVGQVLGQIRDGGLEENTLVMFTSDNGPWYLGSAGKLRGRKGDTWEGGMRAPFIAWMPGRIPAGTVSDAVGSLLDVFPTVAGLTGAPRPDLRLDGVDLWPAFTGEQATIERDVLLYFDHWNIQCARLGPWKLHMSRTNVPAWTEEPSEGRINLPLPRPELYNLERDPSESYECGREYPEVVADIQARVVALLPGFPTAVQNAWRDTANAQTSWTPAGASPASPRP
ncbi:MAG: sulfatase [Bryobacterales bacterium]|nr:sulfatase [Bryobacterales bacterium]